MCAIVGSFNKDKLKELYKLNAYRGELSHSLCTFFNNKKRVEVGVLMQDDGPMSSLLLENIPLKENSYVVAHSQAPTTETKNIHPAVFGDAFLWHNGIIKQKELSEGTWDTIWLLEKIINYGWSYLSNIDGTFACIMYWGGKLFVFRNEISPLYVDNDMNISSTTFENSTFLEPNIVFEIDIENKRLNKVSYFTTKENPYFIPETI